MKNRTLVGVVCGVAVLPAVLVQKANGAEASDGPNRFSLDSRFGFNISARFQDFTASPNAGAAAGPGSHFYDNGDYVRPVGAGASTWDFKFSSDSQVDETAKTLSFTSTKSPLDGYNRRVSGDPQYGLELGYGRVLGKIGSKISFGLDGHFSYTHLDLDKTASVAGEAVNIKDTYNLDGGFFPAPGIRLFPYAPYTGDENDPTHPLIPVNPSARAGGTVPAVGNLNHKLEGDFYGFKIGPFFELPVCRRASLILNGGLAVVGLDNKLTWSESYTTATGTTTRPTVSSTDNAWLLGVYVGGKVNVILSEKWSFRAGAEYQNVGDSMIRTGSKAATLDLSESVFLTLGFGYSF